MARISGRRVLPSVRRRIRMGGFQSSVFACKHEKNLKLRGRTFTGRILLPMRRFSTPASAIPTSFQTVLFTLLKEGFAADAEGFGGAADLVVRSFERGGDDLALHFLEGTQAGDLTGSARRSSSHNLRKILGIEEVILGSRCAAAGTGEDHRALESVAEFANIAGPGIGCKHAARRITQLRIRPGVHGTQGRKKMIGERQYIGAALAKRRNLESENVEPEIKIFTEAA